METDSYKTYDFFPNPTVYFGVVSLRVKLSYLGSKITDPRSYVVSTGTLKLSFEDTMIYDFNA